MFFRENLERVLERNRDTALREVCRVIYHVILTVIARCVCALWGGGGGGMCVCACVCVCHYTGACVCVCGMWRF